MLAPGQELFVSDDDAVKRCEIRSGAYIDDVARERLLHPGEMAIGGDRNLYVATFGNTNAADPRYPAINQYNGRTGFPIDRFASAYLGHPLGVAWRALIFEPAGHRIDRHLHKVPSSEIIYGFTSG